MRKGRLRIFPNPMGNHRSGIDDARVSENSLLLALRQRRGKLLKAEYGAVFLVFALSASSLFADTTLDYTVQNLGGIVLKARDSALKVGYARLKPDTNNTAPSGIAIIGARNNNVLVSEATVTATAPIFKGRIFAEISQSTRTAIAIANPNSQPALISFSFTNTSGVDFSTGTTTIDGNGQIAAYLDKAPFNGGQTVEGTFSFNSNVAVSVTVLRTNLNSFGDVLVSTAPVVNLDATASDALYFPHFADGGGWASQIVLVNPGDTTITGSVRFWKPDGTPASVTIGGQTGDTFGYSIPRRSSQRLQTSNPPDATGTGWVQVNPTTGVAPAGVLIFSLQQFGTIVTEASIPASKQATTLRLYAENSTAAVSRRTVIALSTTSPVPIAVKIVLTPLPGDAAPTYGIPTDLTGTLVLPANGQVAKLLYDIPGLENLPDRFRGVIKIAAPPAATVAATGLLTRVNERGSTLIAATPPTIETDIPSSTELQFPHFAQGDAYTTEFVLYNGLIQQPPSGRLWFYDQQGNPANLDFGAASDVSASFDTFPTQCTFITSSTAIPQCDRLEYKVSVTNNNATNPASGVQLTYVLPVDPPTGVPAASFVANPSVNCTIQNSARLICTLGTLAPSSSTSFTLQLNISTSVRTKIVQNRLMVESETTDSLGLNNSVSKNLTVDVMGPASLDVQIASTTASPNPVTSGSPLAYTIVVANTLTNTATNVVLTTTFAGATDDLTFKYAVSNWGTCAGVGSTYSDPRVICNLSDLQKGQSAVVLIVVQPFNAGPSAANLTATFQVTASGGFELNTANNTASRTVTISPSSP
jgi:hypothetical protein